MRCGRHIAGLKALQHALELDPTNWTAMYAIGDIHSQMQSFGEAVETYEKILAIRGYKEVGVLAALAEAELSLGRQALSEGFRERSRRALHRTIELAGRVLMIGHGHRPWAWKIIGDASFALSGQESNTIEVRSSSECIQPILELLIEDDFDRRSTVEGLGHASNLLQAQLDLNHSLRTAIFAYAYRVHLLKNEPRVVFPALYDFATALHTLASRVDADSTRKSCLKAAIAAIRLALERDAGDERLWNALAVVCGDAGPAVAQHAFVVSLELYSKVS